MFRGSRNVSVEEESRMEGPQLEKIDDFTWRIPKQGPMRTEGILFANETLMKGIRGDECVQQVMNVACLPGIVGPSIAMPDIHWGYGFPIGGVAAFDSREGVVSPGGVGYDINCGVRLIRTHLEEKKVRPQIRGLIEALFREIPAGVGSRRHDVRLSVADEKQVLSKGVRWAVENGFGEAQDLERIESHGTLPGADPSCVSQRGLDGGWKPFWGRPRPWEGPNPWGHPRGRTLFGFLKGFGKGAGSIGDLG